MNDFTCLSFGGGNQSSVLLLMADAGIVTPRLDVAIFADTGWEPAEVYDHIEWMRSTVSIPIVTVSNGRNLRDDLSKGLNDRGMKFSGTNVPLFIRNPDGSKGMVRTRQCTDKYKLRPITKYIREKMLGLKPRQRVPAGVQVEQWLGISTDEITRARDSHDKWRINRYPLIELGMSRGDCKAWFAEHYPGRTLPRSACSGCPFRSDKEWLHLKLTSPSDFEKAVSVDHMIRVNDAKNGFKGTPYLHNRLKPIDEAVEEYERHLAENPMLPGLETGADNECAGVCFV